MRGATRARRLAARGASAAARRSGGRWSVPGLLTVVVTVGVGSDHAPASLEAALAQEHGRIEVLLAGVGVDPVLPEAVAGDDRLRVLGRYADLRAARTAALGAAAGRFVAFLDADHLPTAHGWRAAVASLARTGSGTALLAHRVHRRGRVFDPDDWVRLVHGRPVTATGPATWPPLLADGEAAAAVFRTQHLRRTWRTTPGAAAHDLTLLAAAVREGGVDVLDLVGVRLRALADRTGPARVDLDHAGLRRHVAAIEQAHALLRSVGPDAAAHHTGYALGRLLPPYLDLLWHEEDVREELPDLLGRMVPLAGTAYPSTVPAQQKALHHLLGVDTARARTFLGQVRPSARRHPTTAAAGRALLELGPRWADVPPPARILADVELAVRAEVTALRRDGDEAVLEGWAYLDALDPSGAPAISLCWVAEDPATGGARGPRFGLTVESVTTPRADRESELVWADVSPAGFRARFRPADLPPGRWALEATVAELGLHGSARAVVRPWTMAGMAPCADPAGRTLLVDHDDLQQLRLHVLPADGPRVAASPAGDGIALEVTGATGSGLVLRPVGPGSPVDLAGSRRAGGPVPGAVARTVVDLDRLDPGTPYALEVRGARTTPGPLAARSSHLCAWPGRRGGLLVAAPARAAAVRAVRLEEEELVVELALADEVPGWRTALIQGVAEVPGTLRRLGEARWEARYRLTHRHAGRELPLPGGDHALSVANDRHRDWFVARPDAPELPLEQLQERMRLRVEAFAPDAPAVRLVVGAPLREDELGERHQRLLRESASVEVADRDSVFFRAMFGEHTSGNGLGVHEELRRRGSSLELLWSVADRSVPVPLGGTGVVEHSREWHEAIARARYHLVDVHQVEWFRRPTGQVLIETMHGYPYKLMGHAWWRRMGNSVQEIASLDRRTREWSVLVSPATYATPLLRTAFLDPAAADAVRVLETGYPRNDVLLRPEAGSVRARTRAELGIEEGQVAVLYAPTFRDYLSPEDRTARAVTFFDVEEALASLPEHYVVLRRGHAFNARVREDRLRASARFHDVTDHPDVNDLILASDVGVLDYSSLRFDYVLSGNPMVFLVPDLAEYDAHRGGVIPYAPTAPGPWTTTTAQTVAWLRDLPRLRDEYAAARAAFQDAYVDLEDGRAAARLVEEAFAPEDR